MNILITKNRKQRSHIFRATSPNGKDSFYIYLVKHVLPKSEFGFPEEIEKIIGSSKKVFIESNTESDIAYLNNKALIKLFKYSNQRYDSLQTTQNSQIQKIQGGDLMVLDKPKIDLNLQCMVASMWNLKKEFGGSKNHLMVSLGHLAFSLLHSGEVFFVENEIFKLCQQYNTVLDYLDQDCEIIEQYHNLFVDDLVENTLMILNRFAVKENFDFHKEIEDEMNKQYKKLDFSGTERRMKSQKNFRSSVSQRNHIWIPKMITNPNSLFVIGADHWPGKEGIKELLEEKGYSIQQLD